MLKRTDEAHATRTAANHTTIANVRARSGLLVCLMYCDHPDCPAREVRIRVKDHDDALLPLVRTRGLHCPLCGTPLKVHGVRTMAEQAVVDDREARCSVNAQRFARDHGAVIPTSVLLDDHLPD
jgi:hypothetical protein